MISYIQFVHISISSRVFFTFNNLSFLYRERWYEYDAQHKIINSSNQFAKSMQLILTIDYSEECRELLDINLSRVLSVAEIYHLNILEEVFACTLSNILFSFLELDSIKISSLSNFSTEKEQVFYCISGKNNIIKVNLEKMIDIEDVYFLIKLFPRMSYLKVTHINNMDMKLLKN